MVLIVDYCNKLNKQKQVRLSDFKSDNWIIADHEYQLTRYNLVFLR